MADRKLIVHPGVDWQKAASRAEMFIAYDPPRLAGTAGGLVFTGGIYVYRTPNGTVVVRPVTAKESSNG